MPVIVIVTVSMVLRGFVMQDDKGLASGEAFFGYLFYAQLVAGKPQFGDFGAPMFSMSKPASSRAPRIMSPLAPAKQSKYAIFMFLFLAVA